MITKAETQQKELLPHYEEAAKLVRDPLQLGKSSDDDLMQALTRMEGFLSQARQFRDSLEKQVSAIEREIPSLRRSSPV
jgi:hypothetical protein